MIFVVGAVVFRIIRTAHQTVIEIRHGFENGTGNFMLLFVGTGRSMNLMVIVATVLQVKGSHHTLEELGFACRFEGKHW